MRILLAEDNDKLSSLLQRGLSRVGMVIDVAADGSDAVWMATAAPYDVIVLDVMLPGRNGFEVCQRLRERGHETPILMLTARGTVRDRVAGLDAGADDYMAKPFVVDELVARLRALARRGPITKSRVLTVGDLKLHPAQQRAWRGDTEVELTTKPFLVLEALMERPGELMSRDALLERCWDMNYERKSNIVDVQVRHLRDRIDRPFGTNSIETVRGAGYRLRVEEAE
ncbi:MAG: two-component system, OmpR family, response regulator [Thermoleophilaceae bacterium]|jgi:two-component system OmpR family response regulator|nr:two-component system, OmpR family, response regulator [Thermoleophilaceae bacterium]